MKKTLFLSILSALSLQLTAQCISGNCQNGNGTAIFEEIRYKGNFNNGQIEGFGTAFYPDGRIYEGEWQNRLPHGMGVLKGKQNEEWRGTWETGIPVINGVAMENSKGAPLVSFTGINQPFQIGCLSGDCKNGEGLFGYPDGSTYEGKFINNRPNGYGTTTYINGDKFEGGYKNGHPNGIGRYYLAASKTILNGRWDMGEYIGEVVSTEQKEGCIEGNCKSGKGTYIFKNAEAKYTGAFKNNKPHGSGTCTYSTGEKYTGAWENGVFEGYGTYISKTQVKIEGYWHNGNYVGAKAKEITEGNILKNKDGKVYAAIIGISNYKHMPALSYSDDDAYRMLNFLQSPSGGAIPDEQIFFSVDDTATKQNILNGLRGLFGKAQENDIVLIYFSGHGLQGSFLPIDYDGFEQKIYHDELMSIINSGACTKKLFMADACHSGSLVSKGINKYADFTETVSKFKLKPGSGFILSSKSEEISLESSGIRQGVFTHFLIRALKGEADHNEDKQITIQEVFNFIHNHVRTYTGNQQTPQIYGTYDPTMVILELGE